MRCIFISYSRKDKALADELADALAPLHAMLPCEVWVDSDIAGGDVWEQRLEEKLAAASLMVAMVTPRYLASPWCRREVEHARSAGIPILPVHLSRFSSSVDVFSDLQYVPDLSRAVVEWGPQSFDRDPAWAQVVNAVVRALSQDGQAPGADRSANQPPRGRPSAPPPEAWSAPPSAPTAPSPSQAVLAMGSRTSEPPPLQGVPRGGIDPRVWAGGGLGALVLFVSTLWMTAPDEVVAPPVDPAPHEPPGVTKNAAGELTAGEVVVAPEREEPVSAPPAAPEPQRTAEPIRAAAAPKQPVTPSDVCASPKARPTGRRIADGDYKVQTSNGYTWWWNGPGDQNMNINNQTWDTWHTGSLNYRFHFKQRSDGSYELSSRGDGGTFITTAAGDVVKVTNSKSPDPCSTSWVVTMVEGSASGPVVTIRNVGSGMYVKAGDGFMFRPDLRSGDPGEAGRFTLAPF